MTPSVARNLARSIRELHRTDWLCLALAGLTGVALAISMLASEFLMWGTLLAASSTFMTLAPCTGFISLGIAIWRGVKRHSSGVIIPAFVAGFTLGPLVLLLLGGLLLEL